MAESIAKPEAGVSPAPFDENLYEDAADLEFYDKAAPNNAYDSVYLARVPKYLWEAWSKINEDAELQIGTIRYWTVNGQPRMHLLLNSDRPEHKSLPKEYAFDISSANVANTFVFTEEEPPSTAKSQAKTERPIVASGSTTALKPRRDKVIDKRTRFQPYFRQAAPKKTKLFGKVKYDVNGHPLNQLETELLLKARNEEANKPKHQVTALNKLQTRRVLEPGSSRANNWSDRFLNPAFKPAKAKKVETLKAARIAKDQLLDLIFNCFKEFQYWPLRALKQRLDQPEMYLRQTLDDIAVLNKSGRFANLWCLKPEFSTNTTVVAAAAEIAPDAVADDDGSDGEGEEMEDVLSPQ